MNKTALLVLDFINDIVHHESKSVAIASYVKEHQVIENANKTIAFARLHKIPVVFVRVGFSAGYLECPAHSPVFGRAKEFQILQLDTWGTEFHEKIDFHPNDLVLTKNRVSAFYCTPLEAFLRANKIQNIIFCGVSTDMAVQTTAREAHDRDYKVIIVKDACGSMSAEMHDGALQGLQRIALITSTHDLTTEQLA